jgi:glutaredoxin
MENGKLRDFVETGFFHSVQINAKGGKKEWKKIFCLAHNNPKTPKLDDQGNEIRDKEGNPVLVEQYCPLCAKEKAMLATQDPSLKGVKQEDYTERQKEIHAKNKEIYVNAKKWEAKKFYIVRGIDKGQPKDGVKFWRFKHNFKKQGVHDKLIPALRNFYEEYKIDFSDIEKGSDLIITVVDNEIPGRNITYRDVSSIMPRGSSKLHDDPIVVQQWLDDDITWRDVFKPSKMRVLTPIEYYERIALGTNPFWDDTDQDNKRWVFPNPDDAELQRQANTRDENLDADTPSDNFEVASDIVDSSYNSDINTITKEDVGTYTETEVEVETSKPVEPVVKSEPENTSDVEYDGDEDDDYDNLPF